MGASHTASKLIEICEAKSVGPFDDDGVGPGNVESGFNYARADQNIDLPCDEFHHHSFQLAIRHLAVGHSESAFGHKSLKCSSPFIDTLDPVVKVECLSASTQFSQKRLSYNLIGLSHHMCSDRLPVHGRSFNYGQVAYFP